MNKKKPRMYKCKCGWEGTLDDMITDYDAGGCLRKCPECKTEISLYADKDKPVALSGTPGMKNQCQATFTFNIDLPNNPYITFRCMREKHDDGKHEHIGTNEHGWEFRVDWDEPIHAQQKAAAELFAAKGSKVVQ